MVCTTSLIWQVRDAATQELIHSFTATYEAEMSAQALAFPADKAELCKERWKDLDTRVVEHNIRVVDWDIAGGMSAANPLDSTLL